MVTSDLNWVFVQLRNLKLNQRLLQCRVSVNGFYSVIEREQDSEGEQD